MSKLKVTYARSPVPLYIQVASTLRRRIETGQWLPSQKISTLEELEREFEVARVTVRQAVELLQDEGLVHRRQGRGTFVADHLKDKHWLELETTWDSFIAPIKDNVLRMIKVDNPPAWPKLATEEGKLASEYVFLRSVQLKDDAPYALVSLHLDRNAYERNPEAFRAYGVARRGDARRTGHRAGPSDARHWQRRSRHGELAPSATGRAHCRVPLRCDRS